MQIKHGTNRVALLIPSLGLAIKFPRIFATMLWKQLYHGYLKRRDWGGLWWFLTAPANKMCSFRYFLFRGLLDNLSEFRFYLKTRNKFAWPTYFSLVGIFNIQKLGKVLPFDEVYDVYHAIIGIAGSDVRDAHCFGESDNYCRGSDGKLYLLDYASLNSQLVLQKYSKALRAQL